jgi:hypothetical protein
MQTPGLHEHPGDAMAKSTNSRHRGNPQKSDPGVPTLPSRDGTLGEENPAEAPTSARSPPPLKAAAALEQFQREWP